MNVDIFDFHLPEHLIAQTPLVERSASRLLTLNRRTGEIKHQSFPEIIHYLQPGDVVVLNDTRVIPARLFGIKGDTKAKIEVLLLNQEHDDYWEALVRPGKRVKLGTVICFRDKLKAEVVEERGRGIRLLRFYYNGVFNEILDELGQMPLPPYIREQLNDRERYQTVYAKHEGSVAAPTAGLHFTKEILSNMERKGLQVISITLHVGLGTFRPLCSDKLKGHIMHAEYYEVNEETAHVINETRRYGGRIVAVGTTSARALETVAAKYNGRDIVASSGWTELFIYPGYTFNLVNSLLTNFHLPKSTLIMLASALAGRDQIMAAYEEAIKYNYRFFSFGDAMFIYDNKKETSCKDEA